MPDRTGVVADEAQPSKGVSGSATESISAQIRGEASQILAHYRLGSSVSLLLNDFLNRYLAWPYRATPGRAFDSEGAESSEFGSLIYTSSASLTRVPADKLACAIDVHETLG